MTKHPSPSCVVKVGDGRGFIIEQRISTANFGRKRFGKVRLRRFVERRLVVTAAHCLPKLPPAHALSYEEERTYQNLLGRLDSTEQNVWAQCFFVDPVADIAVLGCPDGQVFANEAESYETLTGDAAALLIGEARNGKGWVLALDGIHWIPTKLQINSGLESSSLEIGPTEPGMSGSPVLNVRGRAIGVVVVGSSVEGRMREESGPQPILTRSLPGWLLPLNSGK